MNRFALVRELVKDPSLRVTEIAWKTGYNKGHVSRLRKEAKGERMSENKLAKTPADGSMAWGCQCGRAYTVTCISSKPAKQWVGLTEREVELIDEMIETQLLHAERCDHMSNSTMAQKQKAWDLERVELLRKLKEKNHG